MTLTNFQAQYLLLTISLEPASLCLRSWPGVHVRVSNPWKTLGDSIILVTFHCS